MTQNKADQLKRKTGLQLRSYEIEIVATLLPLILAKFQRIPYKSYLKEKQDPIADANTDRRSKESGTFNKLKVTYGYLCLASHNIRTRE